MCLSGGKGDGRLLAIVTSEGEVFGKPMVGVPYCCCGACISQGHVLRRSIFTFTSSTVSMCLAPCVFGLCGI